MSKHNIMALNQLAEKDYKELDLKFRQAVKDEWTTTDSMASFLDSKHFSHKLAEKWAEYFMSN